MVFQALENGSTLIITNVSTQKLEEDPVLLDILRCRKSLHRAKNMVKLTVGSTAVQCMGNDPEALTYMKILSPYKVASYHPP